MTQWVRLKTCIMKLMCPVSQEQLFGNTIPKIFQCNIFSECYNNHFTTTLEERLKLCLCFYCGSCSFSEIKDDKRKRRHKQGD